MTTPTHLLIHRYRPGTGPQPGTLEHDHEMQRWEDVDRTLREQGALIGSFALNDAQRLVGPATHDAGDELLFAVHAISVADCDQAVQLAESMPTADYGSIEVRPLMP